MSEKRRFVETRLKREKKDIPLFLRKEIDSDMDGKEVSDKVIDKVMNKLMDKFEHYINASVKIEVTKELRNLMFPNQDKPGHRYLSPINSPRVPPPTPNEV